MASGAPIDDVRPVVRTGQGTPVWLFAAGLGLLALVLFVVLDANRRAATAPPVRLSDTSPALAGGTTTVPPLDIPPPPLPPPLPPERVRVILAPRGPTFVPPAPPPRAAPQIVYVPQPMPPGPPPGPTTVAPARGSSDSPLVFDSTVAEAAAAPAAPASGDAPSGGAGQGSAAPIALAGAARASLMRHRATTVPQGTLIPATLETALDSTRPGLARATVSRNVPGFDGTRVLVPRGSRLIGEYQSNVQRGQRRLLVTWTRLIRPDGATIALASPSADTLGRSGIAARVNSHFLERFAGAILQTALNVGETFAARAGRNDTVAVIGGQGVFGGATTPLTSGNDVPPTLRVRQGAAISVFVARDLDFTAVESRR